MTTAVETEPDVVTIEPTGEDDGSTDQDLVAGYEGKTETVVAPTPNPITPVPTETPTTEADLTDEPDQPEPVVEAPKYVNITEAQLTELQNASKDVAALRDALHRNISGFGSKMGTFEAAMKKMQESTPAGAKLVVTKEHFKELGEQFPELVDMTVAGFNRALDGVKGTAPEPIDIDAKVTDRVKAEIPNIVTTVKQQTAMETMDDLVPGWLETVTSPAYLDWLATQTPAYQQQVHESWKVSDVKGSIDKFDTFTKSKAKPPVTPPTPPSRPSRAAAAVQPRSAGAVGRGSVSTEESEMLAAYKG